MKIPQIGQDVINKTLEQIYDLSKNILIPRLYKDISEGIENLTKIKRCSESLSYAEYTKVKAGLMLIEQVVNEKEPTLIIK